MRVLITGGAGFIGSHTVDALVAAGHEVVVMDSLERAVHTTGAPEYLSRDVRFIRGDVRNKDVFSIALEGVEAVFHFAAYQDYLTDFSKFFSVNTVGTALLYELIIEKKLPVKKIIVASSQAVYGEGRYRCGCGGEDIYPGIREDMALSEGVWEISCRRCGSAMNYLASAEERVNPQNQYAVSKYSQELIAQNLGRRYGIPTVALRYSIVQGPRQSFYNMYSGALRIFALSLYLGKAPPIYEDGQQMRDYVNIEDVVRANMAVFERDESDYGVFNVGGAVPCTVLELYGAVAEELGSGPEPLLDSRYRFGDVRHSVSDTTRLRNLGWEPANTVKKSVRDYIHWLKGRERVEEILEYAGKNMERLGVVRRARTLI